MLPHETYNVFPTALVRYDTKSVITTSDRDDMIQDIETILLDATLMQDSELAMKQQCRPFLFSDHLEFAAKPHWAKLKSTFLDCCANYVNEVEDFHQLKSISLIPTAVRAWFYKSTASITKHTPTVYHDHSPSFLSGIFYLAIPGDKIQGGTEFLDPRAPGHRSCRMVQTPPTEFTWVIFPGWMEHRPMYLDLEDPRYTIAADLYVAPRT